MALARRCRALIRQRYSLVTSCIETSFLFEQTALCLELPIRRVVCQVQAFTPKLAEAMDAGQAMEPLLDLPGYWAVGVGMLQHPDDFVGRLDKTNNRFVGHVVCLAGERHLVDPSADQMARPERGLLIEDPVIGPVASDFGPKKPQWLRNKEGVVLGYWLHPAVAPPKPTTDKILKRLARQLAQEVQRT